MRLSAAALVIATALAMAGAQFARAGEGGDASPGADHALTAALHVEAAPERIRQLISPHIEGDVLIIEGRIDSHIYDYIQYEAAKIVAVKVIELNSLGGSNEWALEIARRVKELGKTTLLTSGHYCASACAYIFAAGRERVAAADAWIGVHGARLGVGYTTSFEGLCFVDLDAGSAFEPHKKGCQDFLAHWREVALASTNEAFDIMESNGVSPDLRSVYFQMLDDPNWPAEMNVIRKPDWRLTAAEALKYRLVTAVLPSTAY
jgi:membrane-bound ClpP family serine protease